MTFGLSGRPTVGAFGYKKAAFPGQKQCLNWKKTASLNHAYSLHAVHPRLLSHLRPIRPNPTYAPCALQVPIAAPITLLTKLP